MLNTKDEVIAVQPENGSSFLFASASVIPLRDRLDGPIIVEAERFDPAELQEWIGAHRLQINQLMDRHRAILFRGLSLDSVDRFQTFLQALGADLMDYSERSTPRSVVHGRVYTSTEYPKSDEIPMHNENSYSHVWPRRVVFCCLEPASQGGETPIADSRAIFDGIPIDIREAFLKKQVMYVRNFGRGIDLSWQEAFQTNDPGQVEAYCQASGIAFEWFDGGTGLHTEQIRAAALRYVPTGEWVWFNQAHLFHISSLPPALRVALCDLFSPRCLPRNACYGDGTAIEDAVLDEIRHAYRKKRVYIEWKRGDALLLDNLFYAHGRMPFTGQRKIIVAMDTVGGRDTSTV